MDFLNTQKQGNTNMNESELAESADSEAIIQDAVNDHANGIGVPETEFAIRLEDFASEIEYLKECARQAGLICIEHIGMVTRPSGTRLRQYHVHHPDGTTVVRHFVTRRAAHIEADHNEWLWVN